MSEDEPETSPGGSRILHHRERTLPVQPTQGDDAHIEAISDHVTRHLGPIRTVLHELVSDLVHVDVHVVAPTDERPFYTLVTSGMSEAPMRAELPDGTALLRGELCIGLPPDWPLAQEDWKVEDNYWPIRWLKTLARLPHEHDTWLGYGHSIPHGDPPQPFAPSTGFVGSLLLPPITAPEEFWSLELGPDEVVDFWGLYALYPEEMDLKLEEGADALVERFAEAGVTEVVELDRPNLCAPE